MANNISASMMTVQLPSAAKGASQFKEPDTATVSAADGQGVAASGKDLPQQTEKMSVTDVKLREAVEHINDYVQTVQRDLSFSMDEASGHLVIKVLDRQSGEVVRQIPSEKVLAMATFIKDARESSVGEKEVPSGMLFSDTT